jgi:hypothetical protein
MRHSPPPIRQDVERAALLEVAEPPGLRVVQRRGRDGVADQGCHGLVIKRLTRHCPSLQGADLLGSAQAAHTSRLPPQPGRCSPAREHDRQQSIFADSRHSIRQGWSEGRADDLDEQPHRSAGRSRARSASLIIRVSCARAGFNALEAPTAPRAMGVPVSATLRGRAGRMAHRCAGRRAPHRERHRAGRA